MPHWADGLFVVYVVAALAIGLIFVFGTDLPWWVKVLGGAFWPITFFVVLWSLRTTRIGQ